jgi:chemotaxis protein MotA
MLAIAGIVLVLAAVFGGYLFESGNPYVLLQPAELLIVCGAAIGIILIANRPAVIRKMLLSAVAAFGPARRTRISFIRSLQMLYELFSYIQRAGTTAVEKDVEEPAQSQIFARYPEFLKDGVTVHFLCDSLRMLVIGATTPQELDHLMDVDIEIQRRSSHEPVSALNAVADALPGLGIVAAVLGVVITMQSIGGAPEKVGEKVAAALVGTFLGILMCYGVVGPVAARVETLGEADTQHLQVLRTAMIAFVRGASPILAIEYGRRSIPEEWRPQFSEMEISIRRDARIPAIPALAGAEQVG